MRRLLAALVSVAALALLAVPTVSAKPRAGPTPDYIFCHDSVPHYSPAALAVPGIGEAISQCVHMHRMSGVARTCLIATVGTAAGLAAGQVILALAARELAHAMVVGGTAACVTAVLDNG